MILEEVIKLGINKQWHEIYDLFNQKSEQIFPNGS